MRYLICAALLVPVLTFSGVVLNTPSNQALNVVETPLGTWETYERMPVPANAQVWTQEISVDLNGDGFHDASASDVRVTVEEISVVYAKLAGTPPPGPVLVELLSPNGVNPRYAFPSETTNMIYQPRPPLVMDTNTTPLKIRFIWPGVWTGGVPEVYLSVRGRLLVR